jgi:hypothetical protein
MGVYIAFWGHSVPLGEKDTPAEMIAELLRDAAVLVAVFAPLDMFVTNRPLTWVRILITVALVLALAAAGIVIEVKRP